MTDKTMRRSASVPKDADASSGTLDEIFLAYCKKLFEEGDYCTDDNFSQFDNGEVKELMKEAFELGQNAQGVLCTQNRCVGFERGKTAGAVNAGCCSCQKERDAWLGRANYLFDLLKEHGIIPERMDDAQCNASIEKIKQAGRDDFKKEAYEQGKCPFCMFNKEMDADKEKIAALEERLKTERQAGRDEARKENEQDNKHIVALTEDLTKKVLERNRTITVLSKEKDALEAELRQWKTGQIIKHLEDLRGKELVLGMPPKEGEKLKKENARLRDALEAVIRSDETPPYCYANENRNLSMTMQGVLPPKGERWLTPRELAKKALEEK